MRGIRIGLNRETREPMRYEVVRRNGSKAPGEGHLTLIGPTRTGKNSILVPAICDFEGSMAIVDPKGENFSICGPYLARKGYRVLGVRPFGDMWQQYIGPEAKQFEKVRDRCEFSARYNPTLLLDPASDTFQTVADTLSDGIITQEGASDENTAHFREGGREIVTGVMTRLAELGTADKNNLPEMRAIICDRPRLFEFAKDAVENTRDEFTREKLSALSEDTAPTSKEIAGFISTAKVQTRFLGNAAIARCLAGSSFRFKDLRRQKTAVFMCLPTRFIAPLKKFFTLLMACALLELLDEGGGLPVLLVADEAALLGYLPIFETLLGVGAGHGVQLFTVWQDALQIRRIYREGFESFIGQSGVSMWFAPREVTTSQYLSDLCGETERIEASKSVGNLFPVEGNVENPAISWSYSHSKDRALYPHQLRALGRDEFILLAPECVTGYVRGLRLPYWEMDEYKNLGVNPYHAQRTANDNAAGGDTRGETRGALWQ